jgi:hypothetical protein
MRACKCIQLAGCLTGLFILSCFVSPAEALDYKGFDIHGYASGGFLYSDHNNYMTADTEDGTFRVFDVGLNIGRDITPTLRIGAQGVVRRLGSMGSDKPRIDWANVDWRPIDEFGIRAGVVKMPFGLYNESRDLDMARTPVFLPQGIYNEQLADFFVGNIGGQIYGRIQAGPVGAFSYNLTLAQVDVDSDDPWASYFVDNVLLNMGLQQGVPNAFPRESYSFDNDYHAGISVVWDTPVNGLRLGSAYNRLKSDMEIRTRNPMLPRFDTEISLERYLSLSAEYRYNQWLLAAEYMTSQFDTDIKLPGAGTVSRKSEGYYAMLSYRFSEWLEMATYYSVYYPNTEDRSGRTFDQISMALGQPGLYPDYLAWQKDFSIAARFDINMNWLFKAEWHLIDGVGQLYPDDNPDGFKRNWNFFAFKTTYTF